MSIDLEVVDLSGINNNNAAVYNEIHEILHDNSDEGNITVPNEWFDMLHKNSYEGSIKIDNERNDALQNKSDKGRTWVTQDFEEVEEIETNNNG